MRVLVVDAGTSSVRVSVVGDDLVVTHEAFAETLPDAPAPGLVEFDAAAYAATALHLAIEVLGSSGPVDGVALCTQRASTVLWDLGTGTPLGPALGWQDLRTVGACLELRARGLHLAPNQTATKAQWLVSQVPAGARPDLALGTIDTWLAWHLTGRAHHVTDATNAAVTGLVRRGAPGEWDPEAIEACDLAGVTRPEIVDSTAVVGRCTALPGAPPLVAMAGDQQASLLGQGCVEPGLAKITFGTGGMLDVVLAAQPTFVRRGPAGTFPIVAWRHGGALTWGLEAVMLAAGTNIQWLRDDLGLLATSEESHAVAAACRDSGGVVYVPAPLGLGTPWWDYGARGTLLGLTRGVGRPQIVRAVLEGVAHRGADLVEAAEADAGISIGTLRIDGGMSDNATFVQALADATGRTVEVAPVREATTRGAALAGLVALGHLGGIGDLAATWTPRMRVEPQVALDRDRWREACGRARGWIPELSGIDL